MCLGNVDELSGSLESKPLLAGGKEYRYLRLCN